MLVFLQMNLKEETLTKKPTLGPLSLTDREKSQASNRRLLPRM